MLACVESRGAVASLKSTVAANMATLLRQSTSPGFRRTIPRPRHARLLSYSLQRCEKQPAHSQLDPMTGELTALPDIDV